MSAKRTAGGYWPLTRAACKTAKIPHQRRHIIRERYGDSVVCDLCGATLEKARPPRPPRKRAA